MAKTYVPVNGDVVRWAIDESGLSLEEVAEKTKVSPTDVEMWVEGTAQPSQGEFTRLVKTLKRPSALFFSERIPTSSTLPESLRSAPGRYGHILKQEERRWVRRALRLQKLVSFLVQQRDEVVDIPRSSTHEDPETVAARVRTWLEISIDEQVSWESANDAWSNWRHRLEELGLLVFVLQLGSDNIRGFSSWDEAAPIIAVNSAYNSQARIFTAFHEVGHLTLRGEAACADLAWPADQTNQTAAGVREERWCEEFAASVLLPRGPFLESVAEFPPEAKDRFELARLVAEEFKVSIRAAAVRLIRLDVEDETLYDLVDERARMLDRDKGFARGRTPNRVQRRVSEYGTSALDEVIAGSAEGLLNLRDLRDYLRLDATEVAEIRELLDVSG